MSRKVPRNLDPNNKTWAGDPNRFGVKMLEKFGWTQGKGLGLRENGTTTHLKVSKKSDHSGVGNEETIDPSLQNSMDYNNFLSNLSKIGQNIKTPAIEKAEEFKVENSKISNPRPSNSKDVQNVYNNNSDSKLSGTQSLAKPQGPRHYIPRRVIEIKLAKRSKKDVNALLASNENEIVNNCNFKVEESKHPASAQDNFTVRSPLDIFEYFSQKKVEKNNKEIAVQEITEKPLETPKPSSKKRKRLEADTNNETKHSLKAEVEGEHPHKKKALTDTDDSSAALVFAAGVESFRNIEQQLVSSESKLSLGMFTLDENDKQEKGKKMSKKRRTTKSRLTDA